MLYLFLVLAIRYGVSYAKGVVVWTKLSVYFRGK